MLLKYCFSLVLHPILNPNSNSEMKKMYEANFKFLYTQDRGYNNKLIDFSLEPIIESQTFPTNYPKRN